MRHLRQLAAAVGTMVLAAAWSGAAPLSAQDPVPPASTYEHPGIQHGSFTLVGNSLTIVVGADVPGSLQVLRGRGGWVEVSARADGGLAGFSISERGSGRLHLTGVGAERLTYMVRVPERARISVRLPGRDLPETMRTLETSARFDWEAPADTSDPPAAEPPGR